MLRELSVAFLLIACLARPAPGQSLHEPPPGLDAPPLPVVWKAEVGNMTALPLVSGETLYLAMARGDLKAVRLSQGSQLWSRSLVRGFQAPPVLAEGILIAAASHPTATAYALDPDDGRTLWKHRVGDIAQAPLTEPGRAIFVSQGGLVRALHPTSGKLLWEARLEGVFPGGALLKGGDLIVLSAGGVVYRLSSATGQHLGSQELGSPAAPGLGMLPDASGFITASFAGRLRGFSFDLSPLPIDVTTAPLLHPPAAGGGRVIVAGSDRILRAYALPSGEQLWERALTGAFAGPPAISADATLVAVGDLEGTAWTLNAASGELLARTPTSQPAAITTWASERLVVAGEGGELLLLEGPPASRSAEPEPVVGSDASRESQ